MPKARITLNAVSKRGFAPGARALYKASASNRTPWRFQSCHGRVQYCGVLESMQMDHLLPKQSQDTQQWPARYRDGVVH